VRLERDRRPPDAAFCGGEHDPHCVTCGDVAEPMTVLDVDRDRELALCAAADEDRWTVEIALVAPVAIGDSLLVHAGTAIARIEPEPGALTDRDAPGSEAEEASRI
jgi:hydrogenase maturation factor